jgi:hypothetical protein
MIHCYCGKMVPVAAAMDSGPGTVRSSGATARQPFWQSPRVRLLIVFGGFTFVFGLLACILVLVLLMDPKAQQNAEAADVGQGKSRDEDTSDADDEADADGDEVVLEQNQASREPLRKAFDALGNRKKLESIKVVQIRGKAHFSASPNVNTVTLTWQSTRRFKYTEINGTMGLELGFVLKGDEGWGWMSKMVKPMDKSTVAEQRLFAYSLSLSNLLPLQEKGYDLVKEGNVKVRGRDCYTIRVKSAGRPDMVLCFDESTHLLAKAAFRAKLSYGYNFQGGEIHFECYYGDYKTVNGVNHWWKYEQFRNGFKHAELILDDIQFFPKVEKNHFTVPQ